jgi:SAM-dependent methyltransferase
VNKPDQNLQRVGVRAASAFDVVVDGYDAVYAAVASSPAFARLWADHACGGPIPAEFAHISFLTLDELQVMAQHLALGEGSVLVDLACGAGGPGLWIAAHSGASVIGVDPSPAGLAQARTRAEQVALADRSLYRQGTFASTGLGNGVADAAVSVDAIQYAPDKAKVFREAYRILRPGGRLAFSAFEVDPERVAGIPVLGVDPVPDYAPLLGVYLGASFAPNHKGMPILRAEDEHDFLRRQVLTSRNIRGGWLTDLALGGLNYQIEHHLFPSMPRPSLGRAQPLVREFCRQQGLPYCQASVIGS